MKNILIIMLLNFASFSFGILKQPGRLQRDDSPMVALETALIREALQRAGKSESTDWPQSSKEFRDLVGIKIK